MSAPLSQSLWASPFKPVTLSQSVDASTCKPVPGSHYYRQKCVLYYNNILFYPLERQTRKRRVYLHTVHMFLLKNYNIRSAYVKMIYVRNSCIAWMIVLCLCFQCVNFKSNQAWRCDRTLSAASFIQSMYFVFVFRTVTFK